MSLLHSLLKSHQVKRALYESGALGLWHRRRNRDRLTVVMFHRVLPVSDPRWSTSDPEYTLDLRLFEACLAFFRQHYNVVAPEAVIAGRPLPERSLLITFDDGWSDNEEFALPALRRAGMPALMFVVGEALDRKQPFWQEQMIGAWLAGRLAADDLRVCLTTLGAPEPTPSSQGDKLAPVRKLIAALERAPHDLRTRVLAGLETKLDDGVRYMITPSQLRTLAEGGFTIGAHGATHAPLTEVPDVDAELSDARRVLEGHLAGTPVTTLSFPHGRWNQRIVERARAAGYHLLFTSVQELPPAHGAEVLGRVGFPADTITRSDGGFAPELLALYLFRRPHGGRVARVPGT